MLLLGLLLPLLLLLLLPLLPCCCHCRCRCRRPLLLLLLLPLLVLLLLPLLLRGNRRCCCHCCCVCRRRLLPLQTRHDLFHQLCGGLVPRCVTTHLMNKGRRRLSYRLLYLRGHARRGWWDRACRASSASSTLFRGRCAADGHLWWRWRGVHGPRRGVSRVCAGWWAVWQWWVRSLW